MDISLQKVGAKRHLNGNSKVKAKRTDTRTDGQTDGHFDLQKALAQRANALKRNDNKVNVAQKDQPISA